MEWLLEGRPATRRLVHSYPATAFASEGAPLASAASAVNESRTRRWMLGACDLGGGMDSAWGFYDRRRRELCFAAS